MRRHRIALLLAALAAAAGALFAGLTATHADARRADAPNWPYFVYRPANLSRAKPVPLVIAPGGGPSGAKYMENITSLDAEADRAGFVAVYPAAEQGYNDTARLKGENPAAPYPDIVYISDVIDKVTKSENIDPTRVYLTGFSSSATFAYRAACILSDKIAAIAPVSGTVVTPNCKPTRPVSVFAVNGTNDPSSPYNGGGGFPSIPSVIAHWRDADGCTSSSTKSVQGVVTTEAWTSCSGGAGVQLATIEGGGHVWPTKSSTGGRYIATPPIVAFFLAHRLAPAGALVAKVVRVTATRSGARRTVAVKLSVNQPARARVSLTRKAHTLAAKSFKAAAGTSILKLAVPRALAAGRYTVKVVVLSASGGAKTITRSVRLPR